MTMFAVVLVPLLAWGFQVPQVTIPQVTIPPITMPPITMPPITVPPDTVPTTIGPTVPPTTTPTVTTVPGTTPTPTTPRPTPATPGTPSGTSGAGPRFTAPQSLAQAGSPDPGGTAPLVGSNREPRAGVPSTSVRPDPAVVEPAETPTSSTEATGTAQVSERANRAGQTQNSPDKSTQQRNVAAFFIVLACTTVLGIGLWLWQRMMQRASG
jgi:hypothetical protein